MEVRIYRPIAGSTLVKIEQMQGLSYTVDASLIAISRSPRGGTSFFTLYNPTIPRENYFSEVRFDQIRDENGNSLGDTYDKVEAELEYIINSVNVDESVTVPKTLFGSERTIDSRTLLSINQEAGEDTMFLDRITLNGASQPYDSVNKATVLTGTQAGSVAIVQTLQHPYCHPDNDHIGRFSFFGMQPESGAEKGIGFVSSSENAPYDSEIDGVYLEVVSSGPRFVIAKNGTKRIIEQSDWNRDKLDGSGGIGNKSGKTLNLQNVQTLVVAYQGNRCGTVRFSFQVESMEIIAHEEYNANEAQSVFMSQSRKPFRAVLRGVGTFSVLSFSIKTEGAKLQEARKRAISSARDLQCTNNANTYVVYGLRLKPGVYSDIDIEHLSIINENRDDFQWSILINPTLNLRGGITWEGIDDSGFEIATNNDFGDPARVLGFDFELSSDFLLAENPHARTRHGLYRPGTKIDGTKTEMFLVCRPVTNGADIYSSIEISEKV